MISPPTSSSTPLADRFGPVRALLRNRFVNVTLRYGLGFALLALIVWRYWEVLDEKTGEQVGLSVVLTRSLQWSSLALGFVACTCAVLATFVRWYLLVRAQDLPFTMRDAMRLGLVGYFFNTFLPGAVGGDLVKAAYLAREQSRRAVAISTLILDRVIGLAGLFWLASLVGGGLYFSGAFDAQLVDPNIRANVQSGLLLAAGIAGGSLMAWVLLLLLPTNWLLAIEAKLRTIRLVGPTLGELMSAVRIYKQKGRYVAAALGLALLSHSGLVLTFYCGARFFSPAHDLPPLGLHLLLVPIGMTIQAFIPLPGGMGGAEAVFGYLYKMLGYPFAAGVLGVMGKRLIEFTLGFLGYLVYLRMGPVAIATKSATADDRVPSEIPRLNAGAVLRARARRRELIGSQRPRDSRPRGLGRLGLAGFGLTPSRPQSLHGLHQRLRRSRRSGRVDIEMRARPHRMEAERVQENPLLAKRFDEPLRRAERRIDADPDEIRVDRRRREFQSGTRPHRGGEHLGVGVIVRQAFDVMIERVEGAGRQDAGLPHAAAELLADAASLRDEIARADEGRADRSAQAFAVADRQRVEAAGPVAARNAGGDDRVPEPGPVEVHREALAASPFGDRLALRQWIDRAAAAVVRVLQADEPGRRQVDVVAMLLAFELADVEDAVRAVERSAGDAGEDRRAAGLVLEDVAIEIAEKLVAGTGVDAHGDLVRHRPRRHEEGRLLAEELGRAAFELADGRVLAEDVVADLGGGHGGPHAGRRPGDGIAAQIEDGTRHGTLSEGVVGGVPAG